MWHCTHLFVPFHKQQQQQQQQTNNINMARKKNKKKAAKSLYGPLSSTFSKKSSPHKASSHTYKRHPRSHNAAHKKQHKVNLKRHFGKDTCIPVQQVKFTLRLPVIVNTGKHTTKSSTDYKDMPWFRSDDDNGGNDDATQDTTLCGGTTSFSSTIPPLRHVSGKNLARLDEELLAFARYVQLTPGEVQARESLIQHVTSICQSTFSNNNKRGKQQSQQQDNNIRLQAFGSYATPEVCTFRSDVDLALWGVVPVAKHTFFCNDGSNDEKKKSALTDSMQQQQQQQQDESNREDRVQKWKEALAELDAQERSDDEIVQQQQRQQRHQQESAAAASATTSGVGGAACDTPDIGGATADVTVNTTDGVGDPSQQQQQETAASPAPAASDTATNDMADNKKDDTKDSTNHNNVTLTMDPQQQQQQQQETATQQETNDILFVIDRQGDELTTVEKEKKQESEDMLQKATEAREHESITPLDSAATAAASFKQSEQHQASSDKRRAASLPLDPNGSAEAPFEVDDGSESNHGSKESDSDDDSADKLESYRDNRAAYVVLCDSESDPEDPPSGQFDDAEQNDFQVSIVSHASLDSKPAAVSVSSTGPTGETRKLVVGALKALGKSLWKSPVIHSVEVRRNARVPIIATGTHLGFEGDIAMGGHNGTDTSQYAASQAKRFRSFAPVVLLLKVLLGQQELDKPFTGGLGSYKLYVLVAHHLEEHLAMGGVDRPSEVLAAFFFRFRKFRDKRNHHNSTISHETLLSLHKVIRCDDGSADLQSVFKLQHCCDLFSKSWTRLLRQLESSDSSASFLVKLIHHGVLRQERDQNRNKASNADRYFQMSKRPPVLLRTQSGSGTQKWQGGGHNKDDSPAKRKRSSPSPVEETVFHTEAAAPPTELMQRWQNRWQQKESSAAGRKRSSPDARAIEGDTGAAQLMAGYGMKRGPHGGLIPRSRPDVEAHQSMSTIPEAVGRATKNRKNKKKQKRDEGLQEIAVAFMTDGPRLSRKEKEQKSKQKRDKALKKIAENPHLSKKEKKEQTRVWYRKNRPSRRERARRNDPNMPLRRSARLKRDGDA